MKPILCPHCTPGSRHPVKLGEYATSGVFVLQRHSWSAVVRELLFVECPLCRRSWRVTVTADGTPVLTPCDPAQVPA